MKIINSFVFLAACCLACGVVALLEGCENLGEMTGLSKSSADKIVLTNEVAQTNAEDTVSADPRPAPKEVWVDDDYTSHTDGWGYDHFSDPNDAIVAVATGGSVYVEAGWYPEGLRGNSKDCHVYMVGDAYFTDSPPPGYHTNKLARATSP